MPSETEWEKAARFTDGRAYPWGNTRRDDHANTRETGLGDTSAVGTFPKGVSQYGCHDMAGNVCEWTSHVLPTYWPDPRPPATVFDHRFLGKNELVGFARGGSWDQDLNHARCASYVPSSCDIRLDNHGFRVVVAPVS